MPGLLVGKLSYTIYSYFFKHGISGESVRMIRAELLLN